MTGASSILERFYKILVDRLGLERNGINPMNTWWEIGADSLDKIDVIMAVEEEFGVVISDVDAEKLNHIEDVVIYLESRVPVSFAVGRQNVF